MRKINNFILSITTMLIIASYSNGCSFQKDSNVETCMNKKGKMMTENADTTDSDITPITNSISIIVPTQEEITPMIETSSNPTPTPTPLSNSEEQEIIEKCKEYVALTFDDGPSKYTEELVELLNEYNVKSTFFVVGNNCKIYPEALSAIYDSGHEIAIHGNTHTSFTKLDLDEVKQEILDTTEYIESFQIVVSNLIRPPYGSLNDNLKQNINSPFILWNIDTEDWKTKDNNSIKNEILNNIEPGSIILMHDTKAVHKVGLEVLTEILPELTKEYNFVTVSELFEYYEINLEPGKTYRKVKIDK